MNEEERRRLYAEAAGNDALVRQEHLAELTCSSCGRRDGTHHPACNVGRRKARQAANDEQAAGRRRRR